MKRTISFALALVVLLGVVFIAGFPVSADPALTVSDECIEILKEYEGFCQYPYWDYGQWTVGYGTRCPSDKLNTYKANGITEEEAEALLKEFIAKYEKDLVSFIKKYSLNTKQQEFDAMFLFSYNCGSGWVYSTSASFHKAMADPNTSADQVILEFGMWSNAGNTPLTSLIKRRLAEANMYLNGVYSRNRPSNYCYVKYDANGGTVLDEVHAFDINSNARTPMTPTHATASFEGWYTAKTGGTKVTTLDASLDGKTLYARWSGVADTQPETKPETEKTEEPKQETESTTLEKALDIRIVTDELNVRKGPGTNYTTVCSLFLNDKVTVTATAKDGSGRLWGQCDKGWVCLQYTNFEKIKNGEPDEPVVPAEPEKEENKAETEKTTGVVTANGCLYIRSGPGTGYEKVGEYPTGAKVEILEQKVSGSTVWGKTDKGWVSMSYVKLGDTASQTPAQNNNTSSGSNTESKGTTGTIKVNGVLNIRSGAGTSYGIAGYYKNGAKVTILEQKTSGGYAWGKTDKGWISMSYVVLDKEGSGGSQSSSGASSDSGSTESTGTSSGQTGTIKVESVLNIRNGAGTGHSVAGYYKNGAKVTILEQKTVGATTWGRTDKGWVSMAFVVLDKQESTDANAKTVTTACLNIRAEASTTAKVVGYLYKGDKVTILEEKTVGSDLWGKTSKGWIALAYTK